MLAISTYYIPRIPTSLVLAALAVMLATLTCLDRELLTKVEEETLADGADVKANMVYN